MTRDDVAPTCLTNDRPRRSRTMLLLHEELARARIRDRRLAAELRSRQLAVARRRPRRPRAAVLRARLAPRLAS